jgi:hypothetical protein
MDFDFDIGDAAGFVGDVAGGCLPTGRGKEGCGCFIVIILVLILLISGLIYFNISHTKSNEVHTSLNEVPVSSSRIQD